MTGKNNRAEELTQNKCTECVSERQRRKIWTGT